MQDAGCGMRDAGCRMRDAGCGMQDAGCRMQDAGCRMQDDFTISPFRYLYIPVCLNIPTLFITLPPYLTIYNFVILTE